MNKVAKRAALAITGAAGSVVALAGPTFAVTTTPPDPTLVVPEIGGELSNGIVDGFTALLPFAIPVMVIFTVWAIAKRLVGAKKTAR